MGVCLSVCVCVWILYNNGTFVKLLKSILSYLSNYLWLILIVTIIFIEKFHFRIMPWILLTCIEIEWMWIYTSCDNNDDDDHDHDHWWHENDGTTTSFICTIIFYPWNKSQMSIIIIIIINTLYNRKKKMKSVPSKYFLFHIKHTNRIRSYIFRLSKNRMFWSIIIKKNNNEIKKVAKVNLLRNWMAAWLYNVKWTVWCVFTTIFLDLI